MNYYFNINSNIKKELQYLNLKLTQEQQEDIAQALFESDTIWSKYYDLQKYLIYKASTTGEIINPDELDLSLVDWDLIEEELNK